MTTLGAAITPPVSTQLAAVAENALDAWLRERGDTLVLIKQILESQQQTQNAMAAVAKSMEATQSQVAQMLSEAARSLSAAAIGLSSRVEQPAPVVNVTMPEPPEREPIVNVTVEAPPVHVQVMEADKPSREVTTVERDSDGRIVRTVTEEI